jgi:hypothetical protein
VGKVSSFDHGILVERGNFYIKKDNPKPDEPPGANIPFSRAFISASALKTRFDFTLSGPRQYAYLLTSKIRTVNKETKERVTDYWTFYSVLKGVGTVSASMRSDGKIYQGANVLFEGAFSEKQLAELKNGMTLNLPAQDEKKAFMRIKSIRELKQFLSKVVGWEGTKWCLEEMGVITPETPKVS